MEATENTVESFNQERAGSFIKQLHNMLTNHPDREKVEVIVNCKIGEKTFTEKVVGFFKGDCNVIEKIENKIFKLKTLDEFRYIKPEVKHTEVGYVAEITF